MFNKILIPLDGTERAAGILPYASMLAKSMDTQLVILSVIDDNSLDVSSPTAHDTGDPGLPMEYTGFIPVERKTFDAPASREWRTAQAHVPERSITQVADRVESRVRRDLELVVNRMRSQEIRAEAEVVFGAPAAKIVEVARSKGCDLIAMSTHGRNLVGRAFLGSVTDKVIRAARVPTLTITPDRASKFRTNGINISEILVPLDGSPLAESALPYVEGLAKRSSLKVVLLRAANLYNVYTPYSGTMIYGGDRHIEAGIETDAYAYLKGVADNLRNKGLEVRCQIERGTPASTIIDVARGLSENMIVMTSHGRSGFRRLVLGSVTDAVIRSAGDPVLVIPSAGTE